MFTLALLKIGTENNPLPTNWRADEYAVVYPYK